jgi:hypothetical protein
MRTALFGLLVALSTVPAWAAGTAYDALRVVGKQRGEAAIAHVVELSGREGAPQPGRWKVISADSAARGGIREIDVEGTRITGERTPNGRTIGAPINLGQLNLDSEGAHTMAEREAKKANFAYDHVNYSLRTGGRAGAPIWELQLVDTRAGATAVVRISADTANLLSLQGLEGRQGATPPPPPDEPPARVVETSRPAPESHREPPMQGGSREEYYRERNVASDNPVNDTVVGRFFNRMSRHMDRRHHQIGDAFHNLFTGDNRNSVPPKGPAPDAEEEIVEAPRPAARPAPDRTGTLYWNERPARREPAPTAGDRVRD